MINQRVAAWNALIKHLDDVIDPTLRNAIKAEYIKRAINEWGYNPETGELPKDNEIELDGWEKEFLQDIKDSATYQIDTRKEKRKKEAKELRLNMYQFIKSGGTLSEIPPSIRSDYIVKIYLEELKKVCGIE